MATVPPLDRIPLRYSSLVLDGSFAEYVSE
jgi:hypothetical protein